MYVYVYVHAHHPTKPHPPTNKTATKTYKQLILPFALAFFLGAYIAYKRQILFVYEPEFESGGTFFAKAYRRMVAALYLMQLALLCVLITNEAFTEIAWLVPLPIITFLGSLVITRSYHDAAAQLPLSVAMEMDEMNKAWGERYAFLTHSYIQPALQPVAKRGGGVISDGGSSNKPPGTAGATAAAPRPQQGQGHGDGGDEEEEDPFSTYVPPRAAPPTGGAAAPVAAPVPAAAGAEAKEVEEGAGNGVEDR